MAEENINAESLKEGASAAENKEANQKAAGNKSGGNGAKAVNLAKSAKGVGESLVSNVGSSASSAGGSDSSYGGAVNNSDDVSGGIQNEMNKAKNTGDQVLNRFLNEKGKQRLQNKNDKLNSAGQNSGSAAEKLQKDMNSTGGGVSGKGVPGSESTAKAAGAKGASTGKAAGKAAQGGKAAGAAVKKAFTSLISAIASNPIILAIIGVVVLLVILIIFLGAMVKDQDDKQSGNYAGNTTPANSEQLNSIAQTWTGMYYQKYSEMSVYANVDLSHVKNPDIDGCDSSGDFVDGCSGMSYQDLTSVDPNSIDETKLYQEGTQDWIDKKIQDINGSEKYLQLSAGALSELDSKLNDGFMNPEQFIRPTYTNCFADDFDWSDSDENHKNPNDIDGDGKVTWKDCQVQHTDGDGNAVDMVAEDDSNKYWLDHSLYLTFAKSTKFDKDDSGNLTKTNEKTDGQWDYGLGTVAHYTAYFQPSRVNGYYIDNVDVICTGDGKVGDNIDFDACKDKKFGDVVNVDISKSEAPSMLADGGAIRSIYSGGKCDSDAPGGCGGKLYVPNSTLYFKDWEDGFKTYSSNEEKLNQDDGNNEYIYTNEENSGEYPTVGLTDSSEWMDEPALSTGIPATEVKYVIDSADTFAGKVSFDIAQAWITQGTAEHTQMLEWTVTKNFEGSDITKTVESQGLDSDDNKDSLQSYDNQVYVYYNGVKAEKSDKNTRLHWVDETDTEITPARKETQEYPCKIVVNDGWVANANEPGGGHYDSSRYKEESSTCEKEVDIPAVRRHTSAHYEDDNGNAYYEGNIVNLSQFQVDYNEGGNYTPAKSDDRSLYSWGAQITAVISVHKQGDLQTYSVYYQGSEPTLKDTVGTKYLDQYISEYSTYVERPYSADGSSYKWACYKADNVPSSSWQTNGRITDFVAASKAKSSSIQIGTSGASDDGTLSDNVNQFCYVDGHQGSAVESLHITDRPLLQVAALAGKMGFTYDDDTGVDWSNVAVEENKIKSSIGSNTDGHFNDVASAGDGKLAEAFNKYGGMYGVDPHLLALIAAEETNGTSIGNITKISAGTYTAYNLGSRSVSTETYGGASTLSDAKKNTSWQNVVNFFRSIPLFKSTTNERSTVNAGAKETITVTDRELSSSDEIDSGMFKGMTGAELSIKAAAMRFQNLQEKYQYNMPMVITAYGAGEDYVDAVLAVYEHETGVSPETAIANRIDTAWMDYRAALLPAATGDTTEVNKEKNSAMKPWEYYGVAEEAKKGVSYAEKVLSRLTYSGLRYQKIDDRYLDEADKKNRTVLDNARSDNEEHVLGVWLPSELKDTLAEKNYFKSGESRGAFIRAWSRLTSETGTITEDDWNEITGKQIAYPDQTWNYDDPAGAEYRADALDYVGYKPEIANEDKSLLISDMLTFGDDSYYGEQDYDSDEFWQAHFATVFGGPSGTWTSGLRAVDIFGRDPEYGSGLSSSVPLDNEQSTISKNMITAEQPTVVRRFGYQTVDGAREYSSSTVYEFNGDDKTVYAPFNGTVVSAGENSYGYYANIAVDTFNDSEITVLIEGMSSLKEGIEPGKVINDSGDVSLGTAGDNNQISVSIIVNGKNEDFDEIYNSFPESEGYYNWVQSSTYDAISGFNTFNPGDYAGKYTNVPSNFSDIGYAAGGYAGGSPETEALWSMLRSYVPDGLLQGSQWRGDQWKQCTVFAYARLAMSGVQLPTFVGGKAFASYVCSVKNYTCITNPTEEQLLSMKPKSIISFVSKYSPVWGHVEYVESVDVNTGTIYISEGHTRRAGGSEWGIMLNRPIQIGNLNSDNGITDSSSIVIAIPND